MDEDISLLLRQGTVPVLVQLSPADVTASSQPPPMVFTVPRQSLLCSLWAPIHEAFSSSVADFGKPSAMWLGLVAPSVASASSSSASSESAASAAVPLNWHTPLGVIADMARLKQVSAQSTEGGDAGSSSDPERRHHAGGVPALAEPLLMTAHFGALPAKSHVLPLSSKREVSILAQHCIKQSAAILFDDTKAFYKLSPAHTQALVDRAIASSADAAASSSSSSSRAADSGHAGSSSSSSPSSAAVRAAVQTEVVAREAFLKAGGVILRRPLRVHNAASGKVVTVGILQEAQQEEGTEEENAAAVHKAGTAGAACRTWRDVLVSCLHIDAAAASADEATEIPGHRLIISGLSQSPMMCTPLAYLCDFFAASDMCLHVIVQ